MMSEYDIREYRPADKAGFLSLHETVFGEKKREAWFEWKYGENPYIDHVPMVVATYQGTVVGARPFFVLPVVSNGEVEVVLQPGDAMVHPDHRRRGLFSRLMETAIERFAGEFPCYFAFPNDASLPAHLTHGGRIVGTRPSYYRIANPRAVARAQTSNKMFQLLGAIATPGAHGYYRLRDWSISDGAEFTVRMESEPPAEELATLYRRSIPSQIHAHRDEQFYQWRFENPDWEYRTYLAADQTAVVAAIVTGTSVGPGLTTTTLTDVVPLQEQPEAALVCLIRQILSEQTDTDVFIAPANGFPGSVLRGFGFHTDDRPPLSMLASQTTQVVRSITTDWELHGHDVRAQDNWVLTFVEVDSR